VVRAEAHVQEVMGLNPAVYWMDVSNAITYPMKRKRINVAKWGTPKTIYLYKVSFEYLPSCLFQNDEIYLEL